MSSGFLSKSKVTAFLKSFGLHTFILFIVEPKPNEANDFFLERSKFRYFSITVKGNASPLKMSIYHDLRRNLLIYLSQALRVKEALEKLLFMSQKHSGNLTAVQQITPSKYIKLLGEGEIISF